MSECQIVCGDFLTSNPPVLPQICSPPDPSPVQSPLPYLTVPVSPSLHPSNLPSLSPTASSTPCSGPDPNWSIKEFCWSQLSPFELPFSPHSRHRPLGKTTSFACRTLRTTIIIKQATNLAQLDNLGPNYRHQTQATLDSSRLFVYPRLVQLFKPGLRSITLPFSRHILPDTLSITKTSTSTKLER